MRVNFDKMGLITPSNMTVTGLYRLSDEIFQQKSSLKFEIHGVVGKTGQNASKTHNFQFWGQFWGEESFFFSQKFQK